MKEKQHLPLFGVGPFYVVVIVAATVGGLWFSAGGKIPAADFGVARLPLALLGVVLVIGGVFLFYGAVIRNKVHKNIKENKLTTTGVYAWTRNPIYSAFLLGCTGVLLLAGNGWLLILPVLFWAFLTVLMKHTEEKWLHTLYGHTYETYCGQVNRCIPWPPKNRGR